MTIDWHFPRQDLSDQYLSTFESGVTSAITLFAPRRMGKTEFLTYDLIPEAEKRGYLPVYVSFWEVKSDPAQCLKDGLKRARKQMGWLERNRGLQLGGMGIRGSVGAHGVAREVEVHFTPTTPETKTLGEIREIFDELTGGKKKLLLCLDEVQHLARDPAFESLIYCLRTILDENRTRIAVVYTGSSRDDLQRLFKRKKAPLFKSSFQRDFPDLGSHYVDHQLDAFYQAAQRKLNFNEALRAFNRLNRVPGDFRDVLEWMIVHGHEDVLEAVEAFRQVNINEGFMERLWGKLRPIDQAILAWVAKGNEGLYQKEAREFMAEWIGVDVAGVKRHTIQNALNRLRGDYLAAKERGAWIFEDPDFLAWVSAKVEEKDLPQRGS